MNTPWIPGDHSGSHGVGLNNVQRRLMLLYGESGGLDISSTLGEETKVVVTIPLERKEER